MAVLVPVGLIRGLKLFRGPEFVHKHLRERHLAEFDATRSGMASLTAGQPQGAASDQFFDADIAEETSPQQYTQRLGTADSASLREGGFSQAVQDAAENVAAHFLLGWTGLVCEWLRWLRGHRAFLC